MIAINTAGCDCDHHSWTEIAMKANLIFTLIYCEDRRPLGAGFYICDLTTVAPLPGTNTPADFENMCLYANVFTCKFNATFKINLIY